MTLEERNEKLAAAQRLILQNFGQNMYYGSEKHCPITAFRAVGDVDYCAEDAFRRAMEKAGFGRSIVQYNDTPGRTKYEVAALFDHAMLQPLSPATSEEH